MENNQREINRAKNMVWSAAGDYSFEPVFLGFRPDGSADDYLNLIHGLAHKWFEWDIIAGVFASFCGKNQELYEGLLWIGLEHAVFEKERAGRPALEDLRQEYAWDNLKKDRSFLHEETVDLLYSGYFKKIIGQKSGLSDYNEKLLQAFLFEKTITTEQAVERTKRLLWEYFSWKEPAVISKKGAYLLTKLYPAFHSPGKVHGGFVKISNQSKEEEDSGWISGQLKKQRHFLFQISRSEAFEEDWQYIGVCFGQSLYQEREQEQIEKRLCTGNHKGMHLYFTRGTEVDFENGFTGSGSVGKKRLADAGRFRREMFLQYQKNLSWYQENRSFYESSISRLARRLERFLESVKPEPDSRAYAGKLNAGQVWKGLYLNDNRIFTRQIEEPSSGFTVDLMLDASSSRKGHQESIACQGYILAESLTRCRIPVQVYSFSSVRRYTVMQLYRTYGEIHKNQEIFRYAAAGSNRDGLALRGASWLMGEALKDDLNLKEVAGNGRYGTAEGSGEKTEKLLIMLTDASPNDEFCAAEGSRLKNREYVDTVGIRDTAHEVHTLKNRGIRVLGIFMGLDQDVKAAREIFGRDFVRIQDISQFADAVGNVLQAVMGRNGR